MITNSRRRNITEEEPLVVEMTCNNYWTFHNNSKHKQRTHPYYYYSTSSSTSTKSWQWIICFSLFLGGSLLWSWSIYHHQQRVQYHDKNGSLDTTRMIEHGNNSNGRINIWDYNAYHRASTKSDFSLLLAQYNDIIETDETSLPNRAYARQRGLDYVRFRGGGKLEFLSNYDAVAFFPANAILIHLDHSLHELLPTDDHIVMTMGNSTGFFAFNLRRATPALAQWQALSKDQDDTDSLTSLRSFLLAHLPSSTIHYLPEQPNGFVGTNRLLQCKPRLPSQSIQEYQMDLSTTVASVCYRYYPKCEVL